MTENTENTVSTEFSPQMMDCWNAVISKSGLTHDLGQTPEWCRRWAESYRSSYERLVVYRDKDAVYPFMIRRVAGLRVIMWIGQENGMASDYCGGAGSYTKLFDFLRELDGWDVVRLQLPHWQGETANIVKAIRRYEKYLWTIDVSYQSVVVDLPETFEEWLAMLGYDSRYKARTCLKRFDKGTARFEILRGADIYPAIDSLIANNAQQWDVLTREQDVAFLKNTVRDLENNKHVFLARLCEGDTTWASALGYRSGSRVFLHTAGVRRERFQGMTPGVTLYALLIQELIKDNMQHVDFCLGLDKYKFHLGGQWVPGHSIVFARNRLAYCWYRTVCSTAAFSRALRELLRRKVKLPQRVAELLTHEKKGEKSYVSQDAAPNSIDQVVAE
jgi:CelD/BcsL family acetyltransferase involved in cellulose biosynthesis